MLNTSVYKGRLVECHRGSRCFVYPYREQDLRFREVSRIQVVFGGEFCRFMLYSGCFLRKLEHKTNKKGDRI